jgi:phenylacetate-coenzyme A ligase PaaK-like adenylate-forming protein
VKFEWQQPDPQSDLVSPIVTDFTRKEQAMVRYRMNDLMQLSDTPCPCGSPFQAVARIEGRQDDIFLLAAADGNLRMVTPDVLRNAVFDADPAIRDFRIVQTGASAILVTLDEDLPREMNTAVQNSIANRLQPLACLPVDIDVARGLTLPFDHKLRRVRRDWHPDQAYK